MVSEDETEVGVLDFEVWRSEVNEEEVFAENVEGEDCREDEEELWQNGFEGVLAFFEAEGVGKNDEDEGKDDAGEIGDSGEGEGFGNGAWAFDEVVEDEN